MRSSEKDYVIIANMGAAAFGRRPHVGNIYGIFLRTSQSFSNFLKLSQIFSNLLNLSQIVSNLLNLSQIVSNLLNLPQFFSNVLNFLKSSQKFSGTYPTPILITLVLITLQYFYEWSSKSKKT